MDDTSLSAGRYLAGFLIGAVVAAIGSCLDFSLFIPIPPPGARPNHVGEALAATVVVMFFGGGFVGAKGFNAESMTDFVAPIVVTYLVTFLLPLTSGLAFVEHPNLSANAGNICFI